MKRFISALLVVLLLVSSTATLAFAAETTTFSAKDVTAEAGDTVKIPFNVSGAAFAAFQGAVTVDAGLTIENIEFTMMAATSFPNVKDGSIIGAQTINAEANGVFLTVTVKVADDIAAGQYNVGLKFDVFTDAAYNTIATEIDPCTITIEAEETEKPTEEPTDPPHVHVFGEWVTVKESTCNVKGLAERVCECGEKETKELDYGPHTFGTEWKFDKTHHWHICSVCNEAYSDKAKHDYKYEIKKQPTEEEKGEQLEFCSVCDYENTIELPALKPGDGPEPTGDISGVVNTGLVVLVITLCSTAAIVIKRKTAV